MLPKFSPPLWRQILRQNFIDMNKLADFLELSDSQRQNLDHRPGFSLNLPYRLALKMTKGEVNDPLFKQFVPTLEENKMASNFLMDPVGDQACRKSGKLLHKYQGRVLLVCTSACAMHCRYCFRQHFEYIASDKIFAEELEIIKEDVTINEVILSGGDPLSLDNNVLKSLLERLSKIPHITKVRFHTRFLIGIPERIDADFLDLLTIPSLQFWFVIHCNHPLELDNDVINALKLIQKKGVCILNQFVLLKGVNDDLKMLCELCTKLVDNGVLPYYMHQLDLVQGAAHFEVPEMEGKKLIEEMTKRLPGYAVPKYVREEFGMSSKTPI